MPAVELDIEILSSRGEQVRNLLRPLTLKGNGPAWQPKSQNRVYVIGTHDGSPPSGFYRDWRFATYVPSYSCMYFELWREFDSNKWFLDRAYLHLYQTNPHEHSETEFLCLHCDPNEPLEAAHSVYKRGPHLHINGWTLPPLSHAHIALQQERHLDLVLVSCDELTAALCWAVKMIKEEVLEAIYEEMIKRT